MNNADLLAEAFRLIVTLRACLRRLILELAEMKVRVTPRP